MAYVHYLMLCITNNYVLALITMKRKLYMWTRTDRNVET